MGVGLAVASGSPAVPSPAERALELEVAAMDAVAGRLAAAELARGVAHAAVLVATLELDTVLAAAGRGLSAVAELALLVRCSEHRADRLLTEARVLGALPGGFGAVRDGLLTVEQCVGFVTATEVLDPPARQRVWEQLLDRLRADLSRGAVLPPARLRELLRRWVIRTDPDAAAARRRTAVEGATVDYRRREDGLVDLWALGLTGPNAHACLTAIEARSAPIGPADERGPGQRRLDALVDLLTGRDRLPDSRSAASGRQGCAGGRRPGCGCRLAAPVPCGAQVHLLVPLGAALGSTGELAEQVGHGPLEPDLLRRLLLTDPVLRLTWVDSDGVPVATSDRTSRPGRDDPDRLRRALLDLAAQPPPDPDSRHPRHPDDHPPPTAGPGPAQTRPTQTGPEGSGPAVTPTDATGPAVPGQGHPAQTPGPYRPPRRLRRLLQLRRPLCEWPGCGARATHCDLDHDRPWPAGPTCACNLGPLCRHHHRIKQTGWTKTRRSGEVRWTSPTGRTWTSPTPHQPPEPSDRPPPGPPATDPLDLLGDLEREHELWATHPDHPTFQDAAPSGYADDHDPDDEPDDPFERHLDWHTRWTLDLQDHQAWQPSPPPVGGHFPA